MSQTSQKLTTTCNAYRAADKIVKQQIDFKDPGSSGKNLNWDFSIVQPINEEYKHFIVQVGCTKFLG